MISEPYGKARPHVIDATLLSALPTLFRKVVIVSGHHCPHSLTLVLLLMMAMVATIVTLVLPLPGDPPCLVVVIPSTSAPDTSLLPHLSHIAMA